MRRAVLLGISDLNPDLVDAWIDDLPVLNGMRKEGVWARLESTVPPGSPQAWTSAISGRNPGSFGVWGSRYRLAHAYTLDNVTDSRVIDERIRTLYRILSRLGQRVGAVNLPATLPPPAIPGGFCVGGGGGEVQDRKPCTWPGGLAGDIEKLVGDYVLDIRELRGSREGLDRSALLSSVRRMDEQRFTLTGYLIREKRCDIVMAVVNGTEAASHLFLRDSDPGHRFHDAGSGNGSVLRDYYRWIDERIGEVRGMLDDDTVLCIFSISSVQRLDGIFNLNEWLLEKGYLNVKNYPGKPTPLENLEVDWTKTRCWAMGESGQIYVNLKGREEKGAVSRDEYDALLGKLGADLGNLSAGGGTSLPVEVFRGDTLHFGAYAHLGPDLLLHIDGGRWRTDQRIGHGGGSVFDTEAPEREIEEGSGRFGYLSLSGSDFPSAGEMKPVSVLDIAPTVVDIMNLRAPYTTMEYEMKGCSLLLAARDSSGKEKVSGKEQEDKVRSRLEALGY